MAEFDIDFETLRAERYELVRTDHFIRQSNFDRELRDRGERKWPGGEHPRGLAFMIFSDPETPTNVWQLAYIEPRGVSKIIRPDSRTLDSAIEVLLSVANMPTANTAQQLALSERLQVDIPKIANALGMLHPHEDHPAEPQSVMAWYWLGRVLKILFDGALSIDPRRLSASMDFFLAPNLNGLPTLKVQPHALQDAIRLHAMRSIASGTAFHACDSCKMPFLSGGARGRGKKKAGAHFCSDPCRWRYYNENKRKRA